MSNPKQTSKNTSVKFVNPNADNFRRNILYSSALHLQQVEKGVHAGMTIVVVGSGPSLQDPAITEAVAQYQRDGAIIVGCKAAIKYLADHGVVCDYGVSMDPGAHIANPDKIAKVPGVKHIIASSSDPELFKYLMEENEHGPASEVLLFHSACGEILEVDLYRTLFDDEWVACGGYNVVNRAVAVAFYMGASQVVLAGADGGWRPNQDFYVDGTRPKRKKVEMSDRGQVDGSEWMSTPDMLASAVSLAKLAQEAAAAGVPDKIKFLGDTLPASLAKREPEFLDRCAKMV